ncbi:hypothetical protein [Rariglobus hedericola]|uniref:Flagellar hook-length control protein FliK n=1 Tax=Rariglobus hedericola TaxID=2597822 RepID=A0A556QPT1_9BACT|nr:hypothetical protein [Rariglobus hedericola]TSJ78653.1 hypothetical protein FPL22_04935 [Rariglobus hedericola]
MTTLPAGFPPTDGGIVSPLNGTDFSGLVPLLADDSGDNSGNIFSSVLGECTDTAPVPSVQPLRAESPGRAPAGTGFVAAVPPALSTSPRAIQLNSAQVIEKKPVIDSDVASEVPAADVETKTVSDDAQPATPIVPVEILSEAISAPLIVSLPELKTIEAPSAGNRSARPFSAEVHTLSDATTRAQPEIRDVSAVPVSVPEPVSAGNELEKSSTPMNAMAPVATPANRVATAMTPADVAQPEMRVEKIAAPVIAALEPALKTVDSAPINNFLIVDNKVDVGSEKTLGTVNAKSRDVMRTKPDSLSSLPVAEPGVSVGREFAAVTPLQSPAIVAGGSAGVSSSEPELKISSHAVDAAGVVREVVELTHEFRARERNSVEVKFNFKDDTELSVRLAYRDGDVQTTFRTDSDSLRAALSHEWQGYAAAAIQQPREYRVSEPVFTRTADFSGSPDQRNAGSSAGGDARQQYSSHANDPAAQPDATLSGSLRSSRFSPATVLPAAGSRSSHDRLLHAFA